MKKILIIALKDLRITYRDFVALLIMIAAPLALTLVMNFAFSGSDSSFSQIPVGIINQDNGMMGEILLNTFTSEELEQYLIAKKYDTFDKATADLENDRLAAVIVIPAGFSDSLINPTSNDTELPLKTNSALNLYPNLTRPVSVQIVEAILDTILTDLNTGFAAAAIGFSELVQQDLVSTGELSAGLGETITQKLEPLFAENNGTIKIETTYQNNQKNSGFDWLSYMAPSMTILYLSFSMNASALSILSEREKGTLSRLLISPNPPVAILIGKIIGTFLIGVTQVLIFILITRFLLNIHWGGIFQVVVFTFLIVLSVASYGILVAALARNSGEASAVSTTITLVFAALAGNFIPRNNFPAWLRTIGYLTPNAWGIEGYLKMIEGASFFAMLPAMGALLSMAVIVLAIAGFVFKRQYQST